MRAAVLLLAFARWLVAADPTFVLETRNWTPYTRTYIGSGLISLSSSRLGTDPAESFRAGLYDHAPGDVPRIAVLPAWNVIDFYDGDAWLNGATSVRRFHQALDMFDGTLATEYEWVNGGRTTGVRVEALVSRAEPELGVIHAEFTPQFSGPIRIRLPLVPWPEPKRYPLERLEKLEGEARSQQNIWYPGHIVPEKCAVRVGERDAEVSLTGLAEGTNQRMVETAATRWPENLPGRSVTRQEAPGACGVELSFAAAAGHTYTFEKFVSLASPAEAGKAASLGYRAVREAHAGAWHQLWQEDIQVEGDSRLQTIIHSMLFYLLGSATEREQRSIPPMGLSTAGYYGHVFWDADTFLFPVLLALHPELAKSLVMFRYQTLDAARHNAERNHRLGAMYPWEAGPDGAETTPRFAYQNAISENHVNADIALEVWQYYAATGDRAWLERYGYPILHDTADFWTSRVTYNRSKDRYEIHGVVSVDEARIGVTDDPYTNAAAKKNLELAVQAARLVGGSPNPKWAEIAKKLFLPRKDLVLIDYPLEFPLSAAERRSMVDRALREQTGRQAGVMMEVEFNPIPAAELGDRSALAALLEKTYRGYLRPPFDVPAETPANDNINFLTGAGAFLQQFVFGYTGLRFSADRGLIRKFPPLLPDSIRRLSLRNVSVRGHRTDIRIPASQ